MSRAIMGSDLFEPVNGTETEREERKATEEQGEGHGVVVATVSAKRVPPMWERGRSPRLTRVIHGWP